MSTPNPSKRDPEIAARLAALPEVVGTAGTDFKAVWELKAQNGRLLLRVNQLEDDCDFYANLATQAVECAERAEARLARAVVLPDRLLAWLGALTLAGDRLRRRLVSPLGFSLLLALWALVGALATGR